LSGESSKVNEENKQTQGSRVMKSEIKIMLAASSVLATAVSSILVLSSLTQSFIFTNSLNVTDFKSVDAYDANVMDSGREITHIHVSIESPQPDLNRVC
jgi:hypothetical protein